MRTYIIGDVHGHYDTLCTLVDRLPKNARLVFVGDLIDRGPKSRDVVRFVHEGGHTPVEFGVEIEKSYVNVDTGCYSNTYGFGELSAYCVETGEVVKVNRRLEELRMDEKTNKPTKTS
ncbi:hypothetical protein YH65_08835 [Sulfurovum lithotrophicum]|uniref:Calcineurin-like phosphoesterase domain-containing protein n=1 Tax=Sulfurovum lithotrophicum TaxID=206403 RepID=A0A7U4M263_9BACT|nr:metallophosphoesterase [Sulfurovum lithotrophicum]AKF25467.1 hypothetical protein YH65_08835 [Sulfurovum lithotrophicum]